MVIYYNNLYDRIMAVYPDLPQVEFIRNIKLRNDGDGNGDYIESWVSEIYSEPTEQQLIAVNLG
jgi:hypothetical protein